MAILKCKMCGGTLDYDPVHDLAVCPYCGSKSTIFDHDRKLFEQFQNQFAALLNQKPDAAPEEGFWVESNREELIREDGEIIEISYLTKRRADMCTMYVAKRNVIYVFDGAHADYAARYRETTSQLTYPSPEMARELANYVPKPVTECKLSDGRIFLAIEKKEGVYPLKMLGTLLDRHVAWVVSRLENLCCLLDYNGMVLNAFTADNLFADPANHQIYLYGGWWFAGPEGAETAGASESVKPYLERADGTSGWRGRGHKPRNTGRTDLESIRLVAAKLLGCPDRESLKRQDSAQHAALPEPFRQFLLHAPEKDARTDFAKWDKTLMESYGERKFIPLAMTEEEVYSQSATDAKKEDVYGTRKLSE